MPHHDRLRWLLVGAGDIAAKRVAAALAAAGELVAVCDLVRERAERTAGQFGAGEVYDDLDRALAATTAEAAYLATPVFLHARQACEVLGSGRHALVEKPLGINAADALQAVFSQSPWRRVASLARLVKNVISIARREMRERKGCDYREYAAPGP